MFLSKKSNLLSKSTILTLYYQLYGCITTLNSNKIYTFTNMCGIGAYISKSSDIDEQKVKKCLDRIGHRGPDAQNFLVHQNISIWHRRLSIIDLSESANQPFVSKCGSYYIVLNGEIYNYIELKEKYLKNITLKTTSDTEVLVEIYRLVGEKVLEEINGMFAFIIYNKNDNSLFIARDHLGKKPLFYINDNHGISFSSEIKGLYSNSNFTINEKSIFYYLQLGYIPEPYTIYEEVKKFPSGKYGVLKNNVLTIHDYVIRDKIPQFTDYSDAKLFLKSTLQNSVEIRLRSDAKFGAFLSGGVDSSLVCAYAQNIVKGGLHTYSIGIPLKTFDESNYAKNVAEVLGTNHHNYDVQEKDLKLLLPEIISIFDEPYADASAIPTMMVSKLASKDVKMVLTGDGGDESFLGYGMYAWARRMNNPLIWTNRKLLYFLFKNGNDRYKRIATIFNVSNKKKLPLHIFSQEQYLFSYNESTQLMNQEFFIDEILNDYQTDLPYATAQAIWDQKHYLKDDLLVKVDRSSMRYGVEARSPLLDYRIIQFANQLPEKYKWNKKTQKFILKDLLEEFIPKEVIHRKKWGFAIPLFKWLREDWEMYKYEYLIPLSELGILNKNRVLNVVTEFENGKDNNYQKLWNFIILSQFFKSLKQ